MKRNNYFLFFLIFIIGIICIILCGHNKSNLVSVFNNKKINIDKNKKYEEITVEKLIYYYRNKSYGDKNYKDKIITVIGNIFDEDDGDDFVTVTLYSNKDEYFYENVICNFDIKYLDKISNILPGKKINVTGIVKGKFYGDVILENCIIK